MLVLGGAIGCGIGVVTMAGDLDFRMPVHAGGKIIFGSNGGALE